MNQHLATIRIVAEERQGVITLDPTGVNLYDLIVEDKKGRANAPAGSLPLGGPDSSSNTVSIREMLAGVKDADGKTYYQQAKRRTSNGSEPTRTSFARHPKPLTLFVHSLYQWTKTRTTP